MKSKLQFEGLDGLLHSTLGDELKKNAELELPDPWQASSTATQSAQLVRESSSPRNSNRLAFEGVEDVINEVLTDASYEIDDTIESQVIDPIDDVYNMRTASEVPTEVNPFQSQSDILPTSSRFITVDDAPSEITAIETSLSPTHPSTQYTSKVRRRGKFPVKKPSNKRRYQILAAITAITLLCVCAMLLSLRNY